MVFIETSLFTKYRSDYLNDEDYRSLQDYLYRTTRSRSSYSRYGGGYVSYAGTWEPKENEEE